MLNQLKAHLSAEQIERIAASAQNVLALTLSAAPDNLPPTASRVGGIGYWPSNSAITRATAAAGRWLCWRNLILAELPHHPSLPNTGLLAFYIDPFDDGLGMDYNNPDNRRNIATVVSLPTPPPPRSAAPSNAPSFPPTPFTKMKTANRKPWPTPNFKHAGRQTRKPKSAAGWRSKQPWWPSGRCRIKRPLAAGEAAVLAALPAFVAEIEQKEVNDISAISAAASPWLAQSEKRVLDLMASGEHTMALMDWYMHDTALYVNGEPVAVNSDWQQTDGAFQADWQHHPEALIQGWAARKNHLVKAINHAGLNETWQAEHSAILEQHQSAHCQPQQAGTLAQRRSIGASTRRALPA